jgi:uncharacterized protein (DUF2147 family)
MSSRLILALSVMTVLCCFPLSLRATDAGEQPGLVGIWATRGNESHVKIEPCGNSLCGSIVWLKQPLNRAGKDKVDSNNPDPNLRMRKIVGLALLSGFQPGDDSKTWTNGTIYDPANGKTYSCTMTLQDPHTLQLRGYVGVAVFGKTQIWTRADANDGGLPTSR